MPSLAGRMSFACAVLPFYKFGHSDGKWPSAALVRPTPARSNGERMIRYCRISGFSNRGNLTIQEIHRRFAEGVSSDLLRSCEGNQGQPRIVHDKTT
jgi:hypothetical protein